MSCYEEAITLERYKELCRAEIEAGGPYRLRIRGGRDGTLMEGVLKPSWWHTAFLEQYPLADADYIISQLETEYLCDHFAIHAHHIKELVKSGSKLAPEPHHMVDRLIFYTKVKGGKEVMEQYVWRNGRAALERLAHEYLADNGLCERT